MKESKKIVTPEYIFASKINGDKNLEGVVHFRTMMVMCVCNKENADKIISALNSESETKQFREENEELKKGIQEAKEMSMGGYRVQTIQILESLLTKDTKNK